MKQFVLCTVLLLIACALAQTPKQRAQTLLATLSQADKITLVHGSGGRYVGNVPAIASAKIPALNLEDGPQGVADGVGKVTCFPASLTIGATWDIDLAGQWAAAMGKEQRIKGTNVMLGPDVNLCRTPVGGRNFEMYGEDPFLTGTLAGPIVKGIQSQGVIACAKHWVDNDQEFERNSVSVVVDERTNFELYYQPFQFAIDAGVGSMMCSYNRINGTYACENEQTVKIDLKQRMGFEGWLMSDWGATHSTVQSALNGLDQQMPDAGYFGANLDKAITDGTVPKERLDDMVLRILTAMYAGGLFDNAQTGDLDQNAVTPEHNALARKLSAAGHVLLKNDAHLLPLNATGAKRIVLIGETASSIPMPTGGGSGGVSCPYVATPLQGIKARAGANVNVTFYEGKDANVAADLAKSADVVILFGHAWSSEGSDRPNFNIEVYEDAFISAVLKVAPNAIVVLYAVGAVLMPWESQAKTIIHGFVPGQEYGNALADVLFGDVNPSAKLPITLPASATEIPTGTVRQYPGVNGAIYYDEKLLMGYRWWDAKGIQPLFPFGHGLSYTTFKYADIVVSGAIPGAVKVSVTVTNTGKVAGSEVAQLYLQFPESAGEPPLLLSGFQKLTLAPGAKGTASFIIDDRRVSIWSVQSHSWTVVKGSFGVLVGSSSRDIRLKATFSV